MNEEAVYQSVVNGDLEIAPDGTIWRVRKRGWDRWTQKAISRPCRRTRAEHDAGDYLQIRAMFDGKRHIALAHRLIYRHLHGQIPIDMTINHRDGDKKNNHPENLELASHSEQQVHALNVLKVGRTDQNGERNAMAKLTVSQVAEIRCRRKAGEKLSEIAADYGVTYQAISKIVRGDRWAG